ncbi:MAG: helix-turn-helix domain-containing protein [Candidatus Peribacteraceae bacterium]|nr:helix-turn-helix domain-containing protein [Candidatus Peribacteraceae bacterium]
MITTELQGLGLSSEEAKVYYALLQLGGSYVSAIAKKADVHRVVCYKILDELVERGLVSSFTKDNVKHFAVESPKILVQKQQEKLTKAQKLLPELLSITNALAYKPKIQYYEGLEGMKNIFEDTLTATGEMLGYTNLEDIPKVFPKEYLKEWAVRKVARNLKTRMLSPHTPAALRYLKTYYPKGFDPNLVEILFVNPREFHFEYEITIYGDKVAILSLNPDERMGLIIESPIYAKTQRAAFQLAWLGATSFIAK